MLKGGVIMDVVTPEQARIAEDAGAVAVMALERVPADVRPRHGHATQLAKLNMERNLAFLGTVGNNAPFDRVLGTVIGIVAPLVPRADRVRRSS